MSSSPRRSLRLAGKEPEHTADVLPSLASAKRSSKQEVSTEWKRMSFHVPRMDNCLIFGKFLAATLSTVATVAATYTWGQAKI
jgi:hypothetical protein